MTTLRAHSAPHHVISAAQLTALGYSKGTIRSFVASERLFRSYDGVYAIGRRELTREGDWLAAVLACAAGAVLSHRSAALLWRLLEHGDGETHVLVPYGSSSKGPRGVHLHRSRTLTEADIIVADHIPVTSVVRTLHDLALNERSDVPVEGAVLAAHRRYDVDLEQLASSNARLRRAVAKYDPLAALTQSRLERKFLALCRRHGLPIPELQEPFASYYADFTWHAFRLIVETDGGAHRTPEQQRRDAIRDRALKATGYEVARFTYAEVVYEPAKVAAELRAIFARRARELRLYSGGA
jgi:very-short-patch-repair endonuclease